MRWEVATSVPISAIPRVLTRLTGAAGVGRAAAPFESPVTPNNNSPPSRDFRQAQISEGTQLALFVLIISCAALAAWLVFTVRRELHSADRWPF